jgi:hypothetical protein
MSWSPGDVVTLREVWRGRVWEARPAIVVRDDPELRIFYRGAGTVAQIPVDTDGREMRLPLGHWRFAEWRAQRNVLSFVLPETAYAVLALSDGPAHEFLGWYINLEDPPRESPIGFDTTDHVLDVLIPPDRSTWTWKDEDELEETISLGLFSPDDAVRFREEGERAARAIIERRSPFDEPWEEWRPDPAWPQPHLPEGWGRVDSSGPD